MAAAANAGSSSPERSAPNSTIGAPPQRRSSRLSALRTTITWVSHTWLARRVPFLTMICPLFLLFSLLGRFGPQFFDDFPAQHLAGGGCRQLVAKLDPVRCA